MAQVNLPPGFELVEDPTPESGSLPPGFELVKESAAPLGLTKAEKIGPVDPLAGLPDYTDTTGLSPLGPIGRGASLLLPAATRVVKAGGAGVKAGLLNLPVVSGPMKAVAKAVKKSWAAGKPIDKVVVGPAPTARLAPGIKEIPRRDAAWGKDTGALGKKGMLGDPKVPTAVYRQQLKEATVPATREWLAKVLAQRSSIDRHYAAKELTK